MSKMKVNQSSNPRLKIGVIDLYTELQSNSKYSLFNEN